MIAREKLLATARSLSGQRNKVIDYYNKHARPLPLGYKVKYEDQACAVFASVPFLMLEWSVIMPPHCRARELYRNMDALGCAVWGDSRNPEPGDLIFFGYGSSVSKIDHVGIFEKEEGGKLFFWDIRSTVMRHSYERGNNRSVRDYGYILAWGIPDYDSVQNTDEQEPTPVIKAGDLVKIKQGAKWYGGQSIKASVMNKRWYVVQNKNGRVVLGMDESERSNIQSPIHEADVEPVTTVPAKPEERDRVPLAVTVTAATYAALERLAQASGKTMGECLDEFF